MDRPARSADSTSKPRRNWWMLCIGIVLAGTSLLRWSRSGLPEQLALAIGVAAMTPAWFLRPFPLRGERLPRWANVLSWIGVAFCAMALCLTFQA